MTPVARPPDDQISAAQAGELVDLVQQLSFSRSIQEVLAAIKRGARRLIGADGISFILKDGEFCFYAEEDAVAPMWKGLRMPSATCISGWCMSHRLPVLIEDIEADPRLTGTREAYRLSFVRSLVMVPVREDDPVAAIGAYWAEHHRCTQTELSLLQGIASASALAIANAELYRSLERSAAEARQLAREADRASAAKSRFLAAASHDLRQPMQALNLFVSVLSGTAAENERPILADIQSCLDRIGELLATLLDLSKLDAGLLRPEITMLPLQTVLDALRQEFAPLAAQKGLILVTVRTSLAGTSDHVLLLTMLRNLVGNAMRFSEHGKIVIGCRRRGGFVEICVHDRGCGIPPDQLPHVFEEFYQVGNANRDHRHGLGLGLSIVQRLAALLGHEIRVASRPGSGSTFAISVPAGADDR